MPDNRRESWNGMNWIRQDKRLAIYLRDGCACMWCGQGAEDGVVLSLDHIKPADDGGSNSERNLVTACVSCNTRRGKRSAEEFAHAVAEYVNHGVTPEDILAGIRSNTRRALRTYREEARALIQRRGSAARAMAHLSEVA